MMFKQVVPVALSALLFAGATLGAVAQTATDGAIGGNVEDQSGAVVPKATVIIHFNSTNAEQQVVSDDSGYFRVIHLTPGLYTVTVTAPGFQQFKSPNVEVQVGQLTDAHPRLGVAGGSEIIQVTSQNPTINTTSNDFAQVVNQIELEDLPVANFRWSSYALLTPGVVADSSGFGLISFRGQSTLLNNVTIDGVDDNQAYFSEERGRTRVGYSTAQSSIQEFQVNTSNYSVEYGRSAGGVVNAVTKSGSNEFHGDAYFFDRDAEWGAKNAFVKQAIQTGFAPNPVVFTPTPIKPKDWRKQQGIGFGGPIVKDKVFFFFAYDKFLRNFPLVSLPNNPATFLATPDAQLPTGLTCASSTLSNVDIGACQLAAGLAHIAPPPAVGKTQAPNYTLVSSTQYAAGAAAYTTGLGGLISTTGIAPRTGDQSIFFPKIDWQVNGKNHISVELNRLRWASPNGIQTGVGVLSNGIASIGNDYVKDTFVIGKLDTSITSTLSNEVRYQYGRDLEFETNDNPTTSFEQKTLLTPAGYANPFGIPPNVGIPNGPSLGTPTFLNRAKYPDERRWQISDTINVVRGHHNLKFGGDFIHTYDLLDNLANQYGSFSYSGSNNLGIAAFLTDVNTTQGCFIASTTPPRPVPCYTSYSQEFGPNGADFAQYDLSGFFQDEWKVTPRLSLTLGVRYEYEEQPSPQAKFNNAKLDGLITAAGLQYQGSTSQFPDNRANFGPRVGFAADIFGTGKTVLRGGYGEFFARLIDSTIYNALIQNGSPNGQFQLAPTTAAAVVGGPTGLQSNGTPLPTFPQVLSPSLFSASNAPNGRSANFFDRNFKLPEIHQADLTLDQELGFGTTFEVSWLASFGRRLPDFVDANLPAPTGKISYTVVDPNNNPIPNGSIVTTNFYSGARPLTAVDAGVPEYGTVTDIFSGVNSNYEALVTQLTHRFNKGLQFNVNYTWSHALDYGENSTVGSNGNVLLDPNNLRQDYGNSNFNVPNRLVMNATYEVPNHFHGIAGYLLNGFQFDPSFQYQTGLPYSAGVSSNTTGLVSTAPLTATGGQQTAILGSINGSGGANRVPNFARNKFQQPRTQDLDLRVSKRLDVSAMDHHATIELLGESFNILNHQNVTGVNTAAYSSQAGTGALTGINTLTPVISATAGAFGTPTNSNSTVNYPVRQLQLGARVQF